MLARFEERERLRDARACLASTRTQRERVEVALLFLNDLDDLTVTEAILFKVDDDEYGVLKVRELDFVS
ncbi:hypothetical protein ASD64_14000 [Mesorhizobium sp. Root157]|nr:hypothetical protein ASD64_14000 [Mesorhizobium sp. Root157]